MDPYNTDENNITTTNLLRNISWNVNGILRMYQNQNGIKICTDKYHLLRAEINSMKPDILLLQEPIGTKFDGYTQKMEWQYAELDGMKKVAADGNGLTAIYINTSRIKQYQVIPIPDHIYPNTEQKNKIYASAIKVYIDTKYRNTDYVVYWSGYRSPNANAISMDNKTKIHNQICTFLQDPAPTIIHGADYNIRSEIMGCKPRPLASSNLKRKYYDGDQLIATMNQKHIQLVNIPHQVTFSRVINGQIQEAIMDTIMTNITNTNDLKYQNTFISSIHCSIQTRS